MLYVTTRSNADPVTAHRALTEDRGEDGGLYLPMRMPEFAPEEIAGLKDMSFGQAVAMVLNRLFGTRLDGWDVDFAIGRYPARCVPMSHRIVIAEVWHNLEWDVSWMVKSLLSAMGGGDAGEPADWARTAVGIAALFGIFSELMKDGTVTPDSPVDIAVSSEDFVPVMSAWYARSWGLPIASIIVCCNENSAPWDLIYKGELRTGAVAIDTATPACDRVVPRDMEQLIYACGGCAEVERFLEACRLGTPYYPGDEAAAMLRRGMHASVVGSKRILSAIPNVYRTNSYILGPYTALAYSGLLDYRARTGESRLALVLSERSPIRDARTVAQAMGIPEEELDTLL